MNLGAVCFLVAALIQFAVGVDLLNEGKADWDHITAGFVLLGIALMGVPMVLPTFKHE